MQRVTVLPKDLMRWRLRNCVVIWGGFMDTGFDGFKDRLQATIGSKSN